jgi:dienelactone hydrolase
MARFGFVVMVFDAFGQGERGVSWRDHRRTEALLAGVSQQGFAEYETQCALRYLATRREVNPSRIGMTGASGGGFNTWITAALEDSIQVAVPVVGTSEFFEQIQVTRELDWYHASEHCHFVPGLIRYANNHELLAMIAPRPLLIIAASKDQSFPIAGVRDVAGYGARLYESFLARERFGFFEDSSSGHGYQKAKREAAYGWFLKWLRGTGDGAPAPEPPTETEPPDSAELRCFPPGRNMPAGPGMIDAVRELARELPPAAPRLALETVFGEMREGARAQAAIRDLPLQRLVIPVEPGLAVPAFLATPAGRPRGLAVVSDDRGKEAAASDPLFLSLLEEGWAVCGIDPRGIGELASGKMGWVSAVSLLLGENFVARQGCDLRRAATALATSEAFSGKPIGIYARGQNSSLAATYLLAQEAQGKWLPVRWFVLREGFLSYRQFLDRPRSVEQSFRLQPDSKERFSPYDREIPFHFFPFRALAHFDLPQLLRLSGVEGMIVNPIDGDWKPMAQAEARKVAPPNVAVHVGENAEAAIVRRLR